MQLLDIDTFITELRLIDVTQEYIDKVLIRISMIPAIEQKKYMLESLDHLQELHKEYCDKIENEIEIQKVKRILKESGINTYDF